VEKLIDMKKELQRIANNDTWDSPDMLQCFSLMDPAVATALLGVRQAKLNAFRSTVLSSEDYTKKALQQKTTIDTTEA
jgi:hypothetical protein